MAYTSRSSSSRGSSRGGRSAPRGGSGGNPMAMVLAVALVGGVIAGIIFLLGGKDGPPAPAPTPTPKAPVATPARPADPPPPPYPSLDPKRIEEIRAEVKTFEPLVKQGQALYDEAMAAKKAGKDDLWQAKLREASAPFDEIQDRWNEIIASLPSTRDYDEEAVANHYLGREGDVVRKALETLAGIKKQRRIQ